MAALSPGNGWREKAGRCRFSLHSAFGCKVRECIGPEGRGGPAGGGGERACRAPLEGADFFKVALVLPLEQLVRLLVAGCNFLCNRE